MHLILNLYKIVEKNKIFLKKLVNNKKNII